MDSVKRNCTESPLLRLPGELRNKVWEFAMGGQYVKVPPCGEAKGGAVTPRSRLRPRASKYKNDKLPSAFHLPEVCRQIYSETATLAYRLNTFIADSSLLNYVNWSTRLLPAHRNAISAVEPEASFFQTWINSRAGSLRQQSFPKLQRIIVSKESMEEVMTFFEYARRSFSLADPGPLVDFQFWTVHKLKALEGEDIEVEFEKGPDVQELLDIANNVIYEDDDEEVEGAEVDDEQEEAEEENGEATNEG